MAKNISDLISLEQAEAARPPSLSLSPSLLSLKIELLTADLSRRARWPWRSTGARASREQHAIPAQLRKSVVPGVCICGGGVSGTEATRARQRLNTTNSHSGDAKEEQHLARQPKQADEAWRAAQRRRRSSSWWSAAAAAGASVSRCPGKHGCPGHAQRAAV